MNIIHSKIIDKGKIKIAQSNEGNRAINLRDCDEWNCVCPEKHGRVELGG